MRQDDAIHVEGTLHATTPMRDRQKMSAKARTARLPLFDAGAILALYVAKDARLGDTCYERRLRSGMFYAITTSI